MKTKLIKLLFSVSCIFLAACAVITVNVYFPEKAAKEAYKSLDDMLLKTGEAPDKQKVPPGIPPAAPQDKPQGRVFDFSLVTAAYAADTDADADALAVELSSMPEVLKAYDDMSKRLARLNALFTGGAVGLSKQGLVVVPPSAKGKLASQDEALVSSENQSRKVVVTSMAKAILKLQKQKESKEAMNQVLGKAAATFAETKREAAQPGWWVQLQNDRWVQK